VGHLLKPEETLAGQLNALKLTLCGRPARFFNLGYPTISLTKDLLILQRALKENPDRLCGSLRWRLFRQKNNSLHRWQPITAR
jgi:hypothetical protein